MLVVTDLELCELRQHKYIKFCAIGLVVSMLITTWNKLGGCISSP